MSNIAAYMRAHNLINMPMNNLRTCCAQKNAFPCFPVGFMAVMKVLRQRGGNLPGACSHTLAGSYKHA